MQSKKCAICAFFFIGLGIGLKSAPDKLLVHRGLYGPFFPGVFCDFLSCFLGISYEISISDALCMFIKNEISIYDFVCALSEAVDLVFPALNSHHKKVAYLACNIALEMNLPNNEVQDIVLAAMLHDIGAFSLGERIKALAFEQFPEEMFQHSLLGYKLLKNFEPLAQAAVLVKFHHTDYDPSRDDVPIGSYIIHLADRIPILFDENREVLDQVPFILEKISKNFHKFHPDVYIAFLRLAKLEYVWVEAFLPSFGTGMIRRVRFSKEIVDLDMLRSFAQVIAQIIDFRCHFTATHSSGVAAVARELAVISGFSERECRMMEIAGLLHDMGKLAVPDNILAKNGSLTNEEFNIMKKHSYYTYAILSKICGLEDIAVWASHHHERQDGNGYPFHVRGEDFSRLARFMVVADIITALTEDRPYRSGMDKKRTMEVLYTMVENGGVDKSIVELAHKNFLRINDVRIRAQQEARKEYDIFHNTNVLFFVQPRQKQIKAV